MENTVKLKTVDKLYHYGRMAVIIILASSTVIMAYYQIFENKDNIALFKKDHKVKGAGKKCPGISHFSLAPMCSCCVGIRNLSSLVLRRVQSDDP